MNIVSFTAVLFLTAATLVQADDRFVCRVDRLKIIRTMGDEGSREEWKVNKGSIYHGDGTKSKFHAVQHADFDLQNFNGDACSPPDNKYESGNEFYGCNFLVDGSRSKAN